VAGSGTRSGYRPRRYDAKLLEALLSGATGRQAATIAGIGLRTVRRRQADPGFVAELTRRQGEALTAVRRRTQWLAMGALETLKVVADDTAMPATARVRAAEIILSRADPTPSRVDADLAASAGSLRDGDDRSPLETLASAIERARRRMDLGAVSANGEQGDGG
jgi:hypothetical protein